MFDIGWSELLIVAVVAVVVIGPKELPRALRALGHWVSKARRMAGDFQRQFNEAIREAELDDVKKQVSDLGKIDPIGDMRKEMTKAEAGIRTDLENATKIDKPKDGAAKPEPATAAAATAVESAASLPEAAEPASAGPPAPTPSTPATPPPAVATGDAKS